MWIEIMVDGKRELVNLDMVESITLYNFRITYDFGDKKSGCLHEYFDTQEEAKERYEEIKRLLVEKPNVEDLLAKSEKEFRRK